MPLVVSSAARRFKDRRRWRDCLDRGPPRVHAGQCTGRMSGSELAAGAAVPTMAAMQAAACECIYHTPVQTPHMIFSILVWLVAAPSRTAAVPNTPLHPTKPRHPASQGS